MGRRGRRDYGQLDGEVIGCLCSSSTKVGKQYLRAEKGRMGVLMMWQHGSWMVMFVPFMSVLCQEVGDMKCAWVICEEVFLVQCNTDGCTAVDDEGCVCGVTLLTGCSNGSVGAVL